MAEGNAPLSITHTVSGGLTREIRVPGAQAEGKRGALIGVVTRGPEDSWSRLKHKLDLEHLH